jgi:RecB family endonuclease NucS
VSSPVQSEKELEELLSANLYLIEDGLRLYVDKNGRAGRQYPTDVGIIDLLCLRQNGEYLVVELKRSKSTDVVVGQISRYIGWVKEKIAAGAAVTGLILTFERDEALKYAINAHTNISVRYLKTRLEIVGENGL